MYVEVYHNEDRLGYIDCIGVGENGVRARMSSDNRLVGISIIDIRATGVIEMAPIDPGLLSVAEFYVDALLFRHASIFCLLEFARTIGADWANDLLVNMAKPGGVEVRIVDEERK